jgi:hypothetical protein
MNNFIKKTLFLIGIMIISYLFLGLLANGYTDPFYLRFTSPKQKSLIIGSSRAAQGIMPSVLNTTLDAKRFINPIYNYSFTILHSPYGNTYYKAIEAKLDKHTTNGLFILDVNPWTISSDKSINYERETKKELGKLKYFNMYPNYDYLINAYKKSIFTTLSNQFVKDTTLKLHDNGWMEVSVKFNIKQFEKSKIEKVKMYKKNNLLRFNISTDRIQWLGKTIDLLNKHGNVILVRVPVSDEILEIEDKLIENFDSLIKTKFKDIPYLNYKNVNKDYLYIDGNHLYKESSKEFSKKLATDINELYLNE